MLWWKMWTFIKVSFCFLRVEGVITNMIFLFVYFFGVFQIFQGFLKVDDYGREYVTG